MAQGGLIGAAGVAVLRTLVRAYQLVVSPALGPRCRHLPTCSDYALEALERHGSLHGAWLAVRRVARCHPWGTSGYDPVPAASPPGEPLQRVPAAPFGAGDER